MPHTRRLPWRMLLVAFLASGLVGPHRQMSQAAPAPVFRETAPVSQWERLLVADPSLPFNGQGSMRRAMTVSRSSVWNKILSIKADSMGLDPRDPKQRKQIEDALQAELDGERLALIAWAKSRNARKSYDSDAFPATPASSLAPITEAFLNKDGTIKIQSIIEARCVRCHSTDVGGHALLSLGSYEAIARYTKLKK